MDAEQHWHRRALAEPVRAARFRVWTYASPAVVLGCSQRRLFDALTAGQPSPDAPALHIRQSGGAAVLCGPWLLSASVVLPATHRLLAGRSLPDSYAWLGELHARWLTELGAPVSAISPSAIADAKAAGAVPPAGALSWACFAGVSPWEVCDTALRKVVGLAQRRGRDQVLFVAGTLLQPPPWHLLTERLQRSESPQSLARLTNDLSTLIGRQVDARACAVALREHLSAALEE